MVLAIPNVTDTQKQGTEAIAYIFNAHFPSWVTNAFLISVCVAIFVCCLAIQVATRRLLFACGRDKMVPFHRFFGYVHPRTKTPMTSAIFIGVASIVVLLYVNLGGGDPFITIARVTAWATAATYIAYQMVVFGGLVARSKGWPKDKAYFNLGRWGWPVNILAFIYGVFTIINLSGPRSRGAARYDNCVVALFAAVVLAVGIIVYLIQRARGVDLSATMHDIDVSPADTQAAEAMAAGMAGKILQPEGTVTDMSVDPPPITKGPRRREGRTVFRARQTLTLLTVAHRAAAKPSAPPALSGLPRSAVGNTRGTGGPERCVRHDPRSRPGRAGTRRRESSRSDLASVRPALQPQVVPGPRRQLHRGGARRPRGVSPARRLRRRRWRSGGLD